MMNRQERRSARKDCADLQKFMEESKEQIYKAFKIPKGLMIDGKLDTSVIPKGGYCYGEKGTCPYWTLSENHPEQENGYCAYLKQGDWEINASTEKTLIDNHGKKWSPAEMPFGIGLLWDQIKDCGINEYTKDEEMEAQGYVKDANGKWVQK